MSDPKPLTPEEEAYLRSLDTLEGLGPRMVDRLLATLDAERARPDALDTFECETCWEAANAAHPDHKPPHRARPDALREALDRIIEADEQHAANGFDPDDPYWENGNHGDSHDHGYDAGIRWAADLIRAALAGKEPTA